MKYLITMVVETDCRRAYKENLSPEWLQEDVGLLMNINNTKLCELKVAPITEQQELGQPDTMSECPEESIPDCLTGDVEYVKPRTVKEVYEQLKLDLEGE
tara:strand:- start:383 stop:682 length:300 start_codon:yes stop_codon:yes gene_type:complete